LQERKRSLTTRDNFCPSSFLRSISSIPCTFSGMSALHSSVPSHPSLAHSQACQLLIPQYLLIHPWHIPHTHTHTHTHAHTPHTHIHTHTHTHAHTLIHIHTHIPRPVSSCSRDLAQALPVSFPLCYLSALSCLSLVFVWPGSLSTVLI